MAIALLFSLATLEGNFTRAAGDAADLSRFSAFQFKLYMSPGEVLAIGRRAYFKTEIKRGACARAAMIEIKKKRRTQLLSLPTRECITRIVFSDKNRGVRAELNFIEDFPQRPDTMHLYSIHTFQKNLSLSTRRTLEERLVARYGVPTVREQDVAAWCTRTEDHECFYSMEFMPGANDIGVADFAFLKSINGQLSGFCVQGLPSADSIDNDVEFELFDIPYAAARSDAMAAAYKMLPRN